MSVRPIQVSQSVDSRTVRCPCCRNPMEDCGESRPGSSLHTFRCVPCKVRKLRNPTDSTRFNTELGAGRRVVPWV